MNEGGGKEEINKTEEPLFRADFPDKSAFNLPKKWEAVFVDCFGPNPKNYPIVAERLRLITQKYKDHNAYPSKFDGLGMEEDELESMAVFDNPKYYLGDPIADNSKYDKYLTKKHAMAEIAKEILYVAMRDELMQQAMQDDAESRGERSPLVIRTKQMLEEIQLGSNSSQGVRLIINPSPLLKHLAPYINWPKE